MQGEPAQEMADNVEYILIPTPDGTEITARIYRPTGAADEALPAAVYFHGGRFVIADIDTYDASCRAMANAAGCIVAFVGYRQAPGRSAVIRRTSP